MNASTFPGAPSAAILGAALSRAIPETAQAE